MVFIFNSLKLITNDLPLYLNYNIFSNINLHNFFIITYNLLIFRIYRKNDSLCAVKLSDFSVALVCSPQFEQEKPDFCEPNQKINTSLIINEVESIYRKILESYFIDKNISLNNTIGLGSIEGIKKYVASNLGISFLPRFTIEEELNNGKLKELNAGCLDAKITAIYAYHKNKWISPAMSLFFELVREDFNIR